MLGIMGWTHSRSVLPEGEGGAGARHGMLLTWTWILVCAALLYFPINMQRRFVEGLQVPLSIVAAVGLVRVALPRLQQTRAFERWLRGQDTVELGYSGLWSLCFSLLWRCLT